MHTTTAMPYTVIRKMLILFALCIALLASPMTRVALAADNAEPIDIAQATIHVEAQLYYGEPVEPDVSVTYNGTTLIPDVDYYEPLVLNRTYPGTGIVHVYGKGSFTGQASKSFVIGWPFSDVNTYTSHYEEICWLAGKKIAAGWDMGGGVYEYRPNASVKRGDMAAFLFRLAKLWGIEGVSDSWQTKESTRKQFTDVSSSTPHAQAIWWLAENDITTGWKTGNGFIFKPNDTIKRGDLAAFVSRLAKKAELRGVSIVSSTAFSDVTRDTAHCEDIWWLAANGISTGWQVFTTKGIGAEFRPNVDVKRGDMAAFIRRLEDLR